MKYLILLIAVLISHNIQAGETNRVSISLASYHVTTDYKPNNIEIYNQRNLGLAIEHKISDNIYIEVGFYNNSLYKISKHRGIILNKKYDSFEIGSNIGFVTGYYKNIIPFARPYIQYNKIRLGYIPKIDKLRTDNVLTLEFIMEI